MAQKRTRRAPKRSKLPAWTPEVTARAQLAELLRTQYAERAREAGLLLDELEAIADHGRRAHDADNLQKEQLATDAAKRGSQKDLREDVYAREEAFRDRLRPIVGELLASPCAEERRLGVWLSHLSFARYRFREIKKLRTEPLGAGGDVGEEATALRRVLREDMTTRMSGLAAFCEAILECGREPIVRRFDARGMSREAIEGLAEDARKLVRMGPNLKRPVPATMIEAEAVRSQRELWQRIRKLIRKAALGVPELERRWKSC